ncbi:MAG TPA: hypothetical protein VGY49_16670 [Burkholderiaceae bacterium]|nr:hypothetical protein [Burkholderiaceae bacterium]
MKPPDETPETVTPSGSIASEGSVWAPAAAFSAQTTRLVAAGRHARPVDRMDVGN